MCVSEVKCCELNLDYGFVSDEGGVPDEGAMKTTTLKLITGTCPVVPNLYVPNATEAETGQAPHKRFINLRATRCVYMRFVTAPASRWRGISIPEGQPLGGGWQPLVLGTGAGRQDEVVLNEMLPPCATRRVVQSGRSHRRGRQLCLAHSRRRTLIPKDVVPTHTPTVTGFIQKVGEVAGAARSSSAWQGWRAARSMRPTPIVFTEAEALNPCGFGFAWQRVSLISNHTFHARPRSPAPPRLGFS